MAHQKGQGHLHDVIFSIPGARRSREMSRISRFRCRRVTLSLQALIIRRPFAESSEAMNPRHRMNANRCRRRVITLNARIAAHQQIEYIKTFDRVECRPPGSTLSRGVGTLGLLAAQCSMSTSITCAVEGWPAFLKEWHKKHFRVTTAGAQTISDILTNVNKPNWIKTGCRCRELKKTCPEAALVEACIDGGTRFQSR